MHQNSPLKSHKGLQCFLSFLHSLYYFSCQYFSTKSTSLTVYISFSNPHQLQSWVWLVKVLFSNREHCGYTCIVVSEGQVKNDCSAGTEKQKIWKKKFHIWKIELLYWAVLKYKSAHKSKYECIYPKKYLLCVSLRCYVCTLQFRNCSSVLACKLSFLTHELFHLMKFCPDWMKQCGLERSTGYSWPQAGCSDWEILSSSLFNLAVVCSLVILPIVESNKCLQLLLYNQLLWYLTVLWKGLQK